LGPSSRRILRQIYWQDKLRVCLLLTGKLNEVRVANGNLGKPQNRIEAVIVICIKYRCGLCDQICVHVSNLRKQLAYAR